MAVDTTTTVGRRIVTALFETDTVADKAVADLVAAGVPRQHIDRTTGSGGFWDSLKGFFMPDEDRHSYAEGLRRGGVLVTVDTEDGNYNRVVDILDTDGAVNLDDRESQWRAEGWNGVTDMPDETGQPGRTGLSAIPLDVGASAPAVPSSAPASVARDEAASPATNWRTDEAARAAALDGSVNATLAAARGTRDTGFDRPRLRSYTLPPTARG